MKKLALYILTMSSIIGITACSDDYLNTSPSTSISSDGIMASASTAIVPLNGIYKTMYSEGWTVTANEQQGDGICGYNLMADCMGEDLVWVADGNGWYSFDTKYTGKSYYARTDFRPYDLWKAGYTWIANANYVLSAEETMEGSTADVNNIIGQAYAIRAYAYFMLAQQYARTYVGHEDEKCVPIYTGATVAGSTGEARSTNKEVFERIWEDINKAITLLKDASTRTSKTHIDYAVACQLKARICMVMNKWQEASDAAQEAIRNTTATLTKDVLSGMNSISQADVMWGAEITADQAQGWGTFLTHVDAVSFIGSDMAMYSTGAPKKINKLLYETMGDKDIRRGWWLPNQADEWGNKLDNTYIQNKFKFSNVSSWLGDMIWMRVEECYLTAAEAECHLGDDASARNLLNELMSYRDEDYNTTKSGNSLGKLTTDKTYSLLEEIITQRRIELWGEGHRIYDIKRLKQGFIRTADMGWAEEYLISENANVRTDNPETWGWVMTIPQAEFDGNVNMDLSTDQNPLDSGL